MACVPTEYYYTTSNGFRFVTPVNNNSDPQNYIITVYSKKNTSVCDIITITVPVSENITPNYYYPPQESSNGQSEPSYEQYKPEDSEPIADDSVVESSDENENSYDESIYDESENEKPLEESSGVEDNSKDESSENGEQSNEEPAGDASGNEMSEDESSTDNEP